tara:strand:+ start:128 stop:406 length:279 start_codon:yes stop_codon:yes gene_type:complete
MRKKFFLIFLFIIFFILSIQIFFQINKNSNEDVLPLYNKKKYLVECKLFNEIIDRKKIDNERQCYYSCSEEDNVRVDTSIGFPCQPFILEER